MALVLLLPSCRLEKIYDGGGRIKVAISGIDGGKVQFNLYDAESGKTAYRTFFGQNGGYIAAPAPGVYSAVAWTMDAARTRINYADNFNLVTAQTPFVEKSSSAAAVGPDAVWVWNSAKVEIPVLPEPDGEYTINVNMIPVTETWHIDVHGVEGLENFSGAEFILDNQYQEKYLKNFSRGKIGALVSSGFHDRDRETVSCRFETFGVPPDGRIRASIDIHSTGGYTHSTTADVTQQMRDTANTARIISIYFETTLFPPQQGGLAPSAQEWDSDLEIIDII